MIYISLLPCSECLTRASIALFLHPSIMGSKRYNSISRSIQLALFRDPNEIKKTVLSYILAFFTLFRIRLIRFGYELFKRLRTETWDIDEEEYRWSFLHKKGSKSLEPMGDLGYSGSVSYTNKDYSIIYHFLSPE